jgi:hypothetical protein
MGNLKKTINASSNRRTKMTISKMYGTAVGKIHSEKFMEPLLKKELEAVSETGVCRLRQTVQLLTLYTEKLDAAMNFPGEGEE